jgi:hypothetical protein
MGTKKMDRDTIIRLAIEAKLVCDWDGGCASAWVEGHDLTPYLERFAALVAAAEREACADECVKQAIGGGFASDCAAAIRARGRE